jgi:hypothetical protein
LQTRPHGPMAAPQGRLWVGGLQVATRARPGPDWVFAAGSDGGETVTVGPRVSYFSTVTVTEMSHDHHESDHWHDSDAPWHRRRGRGSSVATRRRPAPGRRAAAGIPSHGRAEPSE